MNRLFPIWLLLVSLSPANAAITDFRTWRRVEDPPHPSFDASQQATSATLSAGATAIPGGTDIGFQSVNGGTVAASNAGSYFDPSHDFTIAVDYAMTFTSANGFLGLGFGIGEDIDGMNSAGVAMLTSNGSPFLSFGGAARINDVTQSPVAIPLSSSLVGSLFIDYTAASGDVVVGASTTPGGASPAEIGTFAGIQNQWSGENLLASFFLRSDGPLPGSGWLGGDANAVFSNFRVLNGSAVAIPEPSSFMAGLLVVGAVTVRRRRSIN